MFSAIGRLVGAGRQAAAARAAVQEAEAVKAAAKGAAERAAAERQLAKSSEAAGRANKELAKSVVAAGSSATNVSGALADLAQGLTLNLVPFRAFHDLVAQIGPLVGAANPGVMFLMGQAFDRLQATAGTILIPIIQGLTGYVNQWASALAKLAPVFEPLVRTISSAFLGIAQNLVPLFQAAAPFIQLFADSLSYMLRGLSMAVSFFQGALTELLKFLARVFGLTSRFNPNADAAFAVKNVRMASAEQIAKDQFVRQAQAAAGAAAGKTDSDYLKDIAAAAEEGRQVMEALTRAIEELVKWLNGGRGAGGGATGGTAGDTDVGRGYRDGFIGGILGRQMVS